MCEMHPVESNIDYVSGNLARCGNFFSLYCSLFLFLVMGVFIG